MKVVSKIVFIVLLIVLILFLTQFVLNQLLINGLPASLFLSGNSPSQIENTIIEHYKNVTGDDEINYMEGQYSILSEYIDMNNDGDKDLIVQLKSKLTCGSGGCLSSIFLQNDKNNFEAIAFSYAVQNIEPLNTFTNGMRDLKINKDNSHNMVWNGTSYQLEEI